MRALLSIVGLLTVGAVSGCEARPRSDNGLEDYLRAVVTREGRFSGLVRLESYNSSPDGRIICGVASGPGRVSTFFVEFDRRFPDQSYARVMAQTPIGMGAEVTGAKREESFRRWLLVAEECETRSVEIGPAEN